MEILIVILIAYILGSINFSIVISKFIFKDDIRNHGSKNAGATNTLRILGKKIAIIVLTGDVLKGVVAVILGGQIYGDTGRLIALVFAVIGHAYPVFFGFKGGKGVATSAGVFLAFDFRMFLIVIAIFAVVAIITKMVSLASMTASLSVPISMYIFYGTWEFVAVGMLVCLGIIYLHRTNIMRIINKTENKLSFKKK